MLSLLKRGDKYGYELADTVGNQIDVSEGTIYPLLKRLRAEGYFEVYMRESTSGPARKYYRLKMCIRDRLIAFLENNLNEDGSVRIPEPLRMYMGGKDLLQPAMYEYPGNTLPHKHYRAAMPCIVAS